jgi:glycosyltransferase involved in cell wall biosynthesis
MTAHSDAHVFIDATMLYRWRHLAPVGIVRLERLLASHLRFRSTFPTAQYVLWDRGYRPTDQSETEILDDLLTGAVQSEPTDDTASDHVGTPRSDTAAGRRSMRARVRRAGLVALARTPDHLRPFAEQAAWSMATLGVESVRHVQRTRRNRRVAAPARTSSDGHPVKHLVDFPRGCDLVALGLGWEYLDHEAMYRLKHEHGVRIHMPAFDLIPIVMPQMNAGQSDIVHRFYAEMAHYADSITAISFATTAALRSFFDSEQLPCPQLATNQLPSLALPNTAAAGPGRRRHRLEGEPFALTVSTVEVRKNHIMLAKVWAECIRDGLELPRLAIVGRIGWDVEELVKWVRHAPELQDRVDIITDVHDEELAAMYADALFTVFPSRIEGWGMPIAEALASGRACLHADDPAQHEAAQGLMPSLHPDDFVGWKREIVRLAHDEAWRAELEDRIRQEFRPKSVDDYCAAFEAILSDRREAAS